MQILPLRQTNILIEPQPRNPAKPRLMYASDHSEDDEKPLLDFRQTGCCSP